MKRGERTNPRKDKSPVNDGGHYDKGYTGAASDKFRDGWEAIWGVNKKVDTGVKKVNSK
jgi:hypothetical protein